MVITIIPAEMNNQLLYSCIAGLVALSAIFYYAFRRIRKKQLHQQADALLLEEDFIP